MNNSVDIYVNRKKLIVPLIMFGIMSIICLGITLFFIGLSIKVLITGMTAKPVSRFVILIFLIPAISCGLMAYISIFRCATLWYLYRHKGPYMHIDTSGITRFTQSHALHIPWSNIAHISLGSYVSTGHTLAYQHVILIHITDVSLLDKKAYFWARSNPFGFFHGIAISNITTMPLNKLFILLQEHKQRA